MGRIGRLFCCLVQMRNVVPHDPPTTHRKRVGLGFNQIWVKKQTGIIISGYINKTNVLMASERYILNIIFLLIT